MVFDHTPTILHYSVLIHNFLFSFGWFCYDLKWSENKYWKISLNLTRKIAALRAAFF